MSANRCAAYGVATASPDEEDDVVQEVVIRPVDPREDPAVRRVVDEAFGGHAEYELIAALRDDEDAWMPGLSLGAYRGNELVGHVLYTPASVAGIRGVLLAPLAVAPHCQGQGIGGALVRAGLDVARAAGASFALVLGHPEYYPRFGFRPALPQGIAPPYEVEPETAWMVAAFTPGMFEPARGVAEVAEPFMDPAMWRE